jgi:hypothetical protein
MLVVLMYARELVLLELAAQETQAVAEVQAVTVDTVFTLLVVVVTAELAVLHRHLHLPAEEEQDLLEMLLA